jgi:hypothetical protein
LIHALIANGDSLQYFPETGLPIYFLADTTADSGTVRVRVGLIGSGGGGTASSITTNYPDSLAINSHKIEEIRKELKQKAGKEIKPEKNVKNNSAVLNSTEETYCDIFEITWETQKDVNVYIDECGNPDWACPEGIKRPKFDVKEINIGNALPDEKKYIKNYCIPNYGFFGGILEGPTWDPTPSGEPCFSKEKGIWQIKYDMEVIFIRAYTVFCSECTDEEKIIRAKDDVWTKIPQDNICDAMTDFVSSLTYGLHEDYVIEPAIMKHERRHKEDFFTAIATTMYQYPLDSDEKYNTRFLETKYKCIDAPTQDLAVNRITMYLETLLEEFKSDLGAVFKDITGEKGSNKNAEYESNTTHKHPDVQDEIGEYIKEMNKRIDSINKSIVDETEKLKCKVEKW